MSLTVARQKGPDNMPYSICVIDDTIPASTAEHMKDSDLLNSSNLAYLISEKDWVEEVVKNLIDTLINAKQDDGITPKWDVYGFTNPSFLLNTLKEKLARFDVIVYDWDYPGTGQGGGIDAEDILLQILRNTFCLVFIFSGVDKQDEINQILEKPEFIEYKKRRELLDKESNGKEQSSILIQKAEEMYKSNFSFRFAGQLRRTSLQIIDGVLSDLGRATSNELKNYLSIDESNEKRDFVNFVVERFKSGLVTADLPALEENEQQQAAPIDNELLKRIWSHRLYLPSESVDYDGPVRRGDIVKIEENYFVVVSADCDLTRFWHKNFGQINVVPLNLLSNSNAGLRDMLTFCVSGSKIRKHEIGHLLDKIGSLPEGPFILPFLKVNQDYNNFIVLPKEITTRKIRIPSEVSELQEKKRRQNTYLKYKWWDGAEKVCSVSEPFVTALVQHIFSVLGGYGVPDYPPSMKDIFNTMLNDFIPNEESAS